MYRLTEIPKFSRVSLWTWTRPYARLPNQIDPRILMSLDPKPDIERIKDIEKQLENYEKKQSQKTEERKSGQENSRGEKVDEKGHIDQTPSEKTASAKKVMSEHKKSHGGPKQKPSGSQRNASPSKGNATKTGR